MMKPYYQLKTKDGLDIKSYKKMAILANPQVNSDTEGVLKVTYGHRDFWNKAAFHGKKQLVDLLKVFTEPDLLEHMSD